MAYALGRITADLAKTGHEYAIPMLQAMLVAALKEDAYFVYFKKWLGPDREGCTVLLRDELALRFKDDENVLAAATARKFYDPWHECWTALDSARLHIRLEDEGT